MWGSYGYRPVCGLTFAALMTGVFRLPVSPLREWPAPSYRKQYWFLQYLQNLVGS